jgi:hypothetical protein
MATGISVFSESDGDRTAKDIAAEMLSGYDPVSAVGFSPATAGGEWP